MLSSTQSLVALWILFSFALVPREGCQAFVPVVVPLQQQPSLASSALKSLVTTHSSLSSSASSALYALSSSSSEQTSSSSSAKQQGISPARRKELMARTGPYFRLNRSTREIEFGATANLVTQLYEDEYDVNGDDDVDGSNGRKLIETWLRDSHSLAMSIWDPSLTQNVGNSVYRLQVMKLQFVTLQLQPWVDVQMKTVTAQSVKDPQYTFPLFQLQSIQFDPNVEIASLFRSGNSRSITAESLGIVIHVVGDLRPNFTGNGVTGKIAFCTTGILPPPLVLLPDVVLRAACDTINQTIVRFATQSFQKGAREQFQHFRRKQKQIEKEQQQQQQEEQKQP